MPEPYRHIEFHMQSGVLVIVLQETELRDNYLAITVADEMKHAVLESDAQNVILDLEKMTVLTSAALLPILGLRGCVKDRHGDLVLCNLSDLVAQTLAISQLIVERRNLKAHLRTADDRASALAILLAE